MKVIFQLFLVLIPYPLRRLLLIKLYKYELDKDSHIGLSYIFPKELILEKGAKIGHLNIAIHLQKIHLHSNSKIGRKNWITGFPLNNKKHFSHQTNRNPALILGRESAITKNHHFDCTDQIKIGNYSIIGGYASQFITHAIDIIENQQNSKAIEIGDYTYIGTNVVVLGGSKLPSYSVLGAKSLLNKHFQESYNLYAGNPATKIKSLPVDAKYFKREKGFVH
jgi:acetyltransferase-like isoleucine patch superfamily enzyme